ncbi:MAG: PKD domain-containing protein [Chitinophagales bacterium]
MKTLLTYLSLLVILALFSKKGNATTYYFSSTDGDDSRTAAQAQNSATPWKSLTKLNSFFSSLQPGDAVLFKSGDIFYGNIVAIKSGTSAAPISFGAYGSGNKPVITGFYTVPSWNSLGGNLYSAVVSSAQSAMGMLTINGNFQPVSRWPKVTSSNSGYLTYQSFSGTSSITSNAIGSALNYAGGEVVIRADHYNIDRGIISAQSSSTVTFSMEAGGPLEPLTNNFGFFFQNHPNACTQQGDWCFIPGSKTVEIYSTSTPSNINVSVVQNNVTIASQSYITFDGISFTGANQNAFNLTGSNNIKIQNCDISFVGVNGVSTNSACSSTTLDNCSLNYIMNNGLDCNNSSSWTINGNSLHHVGDIPGMGVSGDGEYVAMAYIGNNSLIQYNSLISLGYHGIQLGGSAAKNFTIQNNFVDSFCLVKDDGGGVYTYKNTGAGNKIIQNNIVLNGMGAPNGTSNGVAGGGATGIYSDNTSDYMQVLNNSVANCNFDGILFNDGLSPTIRGNTVYNCGTSGTGGSIELAHWSGETAFTNVAIKRNIFVAKASNQFSAVFITNDGTTIPSFFGSSDSNYFARPMAQTGVVETQQGSVSQRTVAQWQSFISQEAHSKGSPMTITDVNNLRFEYNATSSNKVVNLGATYMDVTGKNYAGTITLAPYTSAVLIYVSGTIANQPPVANAGLDQNITLPVNSASLNGSGTDPDGTIASYQWTKISGPSQFTIVSPAQAQTTVNNLVQGIYQFELTVTDNSGATDKDTVSVTVNPASNQAPVAVAGNPQIITLPSNSVILDGSSSTDADGTITSYQWTKISGPASAVIVSPNLATTTVTTLVQGVYQFQLQVTDNSGATGKDTVSITVNASTNQAPTANAGSGINITLPLNSITLTGTGTDPDGTIVSYQWTKISGPSQYNIVSATQSQTSVNNLAQGVYRFSLTVTDNQGAVGRDTVTVTVTAAPPNQPPTSNAGLDINITLPLNNVTLNGSGSDPDGTIASYQWAKISGPSQFNIVSATQPQTTVVNLVQGSYQFSLIVTDNQGAVGRDTVTVIVNAVPNQPPTANAGPDINDTLPQNSVTLNGSGSDPDGTIASYQWTKISGPSQYNIVSATQPQTTVNNLAQGIYQFELKVTDNQAAVGKDTVVVTVNAAPNQPPVANAGPDMIITLPTNSGTLNGSGTDADGTIASYQWSKISGPSQFGIVSATQAQTTVNNLVQGIYSFVLRVTDNSGAIAKDTVQVTVNAAPNQPPVADAGVDITITLPVNTVTLNGSGDDPDGTIASYQWSKISGPSQYNIVSATQAQTTVTNLVQGIYSFVLKVTDNSGAIATDTVQVTVNVAPNQPPVANAGSDMTITLPVSSATLNGSGNDPDGTVVSYQWSKISGPSQYNISSAAQAQTTINNLVQGIYSFELTVTDNSGATAMDTVHVIVNAAVQPPNQAPTANAGSDITITLPVNSTTLNGSGNDPDGTIASYQWTKISGPSQYRIRSSRQAQTTLSNLVQGIYLFELKVTDNLGATAADTVQVTVNAAPINQPPIANAGSDIIITLPVNTVTLNGSGTDADGTIVAYQWFRISGPSQYIIASSTQAQTAVNNLVQGLYSFVLKVTDNSGATATDTIQVTVNTAPNQPPVANAGSDITITLPVNSVTLNGSGNDQDGTIVSYQWSKISGPSQYNIVSATQAQTSVNNLVQGIYSFVLKVTDNSGATATDTVQVTVNVAPNEPPVANAGSDITITLPFNSTTLNGSGNDPDGTIVSYQWSKISGPSQYNIVSAAQAQTTVNNLVQGIYSFELTVTDNSGATATDTVHVTVYAAVQPPNQPPAANAGSDITITLPVNSTTLNGSGTDPDGTIASYQWTKISGPSQYRIRSSRQAQTTLSNLVQGIYLFELKVTDNSGATAADTVQVNVNAAPINQPPVANAGSDINITLPVNSTILLGSGSDPDGTIVAYQWFKISGPAQYGIVSATQAQTTVNNLVQGIYSFALKVTDNSGATATDTVHVIVNAAPNQPPVANAGVDITITLPVNTVTLNGSGDDPDGTIVSYQWSKISGPSQYNIVSATQAQTTVNNLVQGIYSFVLKVTDNSGATATDTVQVTVNVALNEPPVANAGSDITITLPVNSTTLNGNGSDPDGTITSYQWSKISGPSQYNIVSAAQAQTTVNNLVQGIYSFELKVTDNSGAIATDTVHVIVNAAPNQPPVANAGSDMTITLPVNSTTLNGSGTDPDGTIVSYQWSKISGPSQYRVGSSRQAQTTISNLVQGIYLFELKVTDNSGATAADTVQVTVNPAPINQPPVANAGADIIITLPVNTVTLNGSGNDPDGTIASYQWTKISGPSQYIIASIAQAQTTVNNLVQGIYSFVLKVTDNSGATATDTVQVTVNAAPNQSPLANAGSDITITLPVDSATLNGSGTDPDGTIASYQWTKISGPSQYNIVSATQGQTIINNLVQGIYEFELKVTDNSGATGKDTVQVTVNPSTQAENQAPIADAGPDINITLPVNSVVLAGSASDSDGTIASYQWTKISGPSEYTMPFSTEAQITVSDLVVGEYQFELKVTDNLGAVGRDTVKVTVSQALTTTAEIFPNPATNQINIQIKSDSKTSNTNLRIYDSKGLVVYQENFVRGQQTMTKQINVSNLTNGVYFVEMNVDTNQIMTLPFVKQ